MEKDLVCGKTISDAEVVQVDKGASKYATKREHNGKWFYFCGLMCRTRFIANPDQYIKQAPPGVAKKG